MLNWALLTLLLSSVTLAARVTLPAELSQYESRSQIAQGRVEALPGLDEKLDFDMYAGTITVNEEAGRALYYILAESSTVEQAPVVLWLNGGPGCSSIAGGFMSENGPFYPTESDKLIRNRWAWNLVANIVFLDSPAFVGWSYSNTSADATVGDERTAQDTYSFLKRFLQRYPHFQGRPLWIAGESYAGHYIPQLTLVALEHRHEWAGAGLSLQGFLLGDPLSDPASDDEGAIEFWHSADIISDETYKGLRTCDFSEIYPLNAAEQDATCYAALLSSFKEFHEINIYDISVDSCLRAQAVAPARQLAAAAGTQPQLLGPFMAAQAGRQRADGGSPSNDDVTPGYDPCIDLEVEAYLNRPEVQQALHANASGSLPGPWRQCTSALNYSQADVYLSMLPVWHKLLESDLRFLVYSGDEDAILPHLGTRIWINKLGLPISEPWRAWHSSTGQVGGHAIVYGPRHEKGTGLTFATVRGAGHMVPYTQPERAFSLFSRWIAEASAI